MSELDFDPRILQAVVFDFDGVILESAALKEQAFLDLFAEYPQHLDAIRRHHRQNLGVSRYEKFEWIYENLLDKTLSQSASKSLGERFSTLVLDKTLRCPLVPGALELIQRLSLEMPLFVASATPHAELVHVVEARELGRYFRSVHGSPPAKSVIVQSLIDEHRLVAERVLVIGDGITDCEAARAAGCRFIARDDPVAPAQPWPAGTFRIPTMEPLAACLTQDR